MRGGQNLKPCYLSHKEDRKLINLTMKILLVGGQIGRETPGLVPIPEVKPPGGVESTAPHGAGNPRRCQPNLFLENF